MTSRQRARFSMRLGLALALAGLMPAGTYVASAAGLSSYVSPDFCGAIVIHPLRISKSTLADALKSGLPKQAASADPAATLAALGQMVSLAPGMDLAKLAKLIEGKSIVRIVVLIDPMPAAGLPAGPGIIVQFAEDIDGDAIFSVISSDWQPAETGGIRYKKLTMPGKPVIAALAPDARTLIAGLEVTVVKMLAKNEGSKPLVKQLQHSSFNNDILVEYLAEPLLAAKAKAGPTSLGPDGDEFLKAFKSFSIKLNFSGETLFHAEAATDSAETAAKDSAEAVKAVAWAKTQFEAIKKQPPPPIVPKEAMPPLFKVGDETLAGLTVKNDGPSVVIDLPMPASLPDALKLAAKLGGQMAAPPPGGPRPK